MVEGCVLFLCRLIAKADFEARAHFLITYFFFHNHIFFFCGEQKPGFQFFCTLLAKMGTWRVHCTHRHAGHTQTRSATGDASRRKSLSERRMVGDDLAALFRPDLRALFCSGLIFRAP